MFDLTGLKAAVALHGRVARIVIAGIEGSSPRETGTAMLVWPEGSQGTIGGGALEWQAMARARAQLRTGPAAQLWREALGPQLGQCCGGAVTLLCEVFEAATLAQDWLARAEGLVARPLPGPLPTKARRHSEAAAEADAGSAAAPMAALPLAVQRLRAGARNASRRPAPQMLAGWMLEPIAAPSRPLWIWGAGHVGRALVEVLSPLPDFSLTWIDSGPERFPEAETPGVTRLWAEALGMAEFCRYAPEQAEHLILTYSHAVDLEICHRLLLKTGFRSAGLIGSETKRARFRSRLAALGHSAAAIERIHCPIGDPRLGKAPQAIAIGVAAELLGRYHPAETEITDDDRDCRAAAHRGRDQGLSGGGRQ